MHLTLTITTWVNISRSIRTGISGSPVGAKFSASSHSPRHLRSSTRVAGEVDVSRIDSSSGDGGGYTWTISFPLSARNVPELGFDGAALEGKGAAGNIVETQAARVPEIQRVSTVAGSEVYGGFTLMFFDEETELLSHNATAEEVRTT